MSFLYPFITEAAAATAPATGPASLSISYDVNITTIIAGLVVVIGYIGSIFTMKAKVESSIKDNHDGRTKIDSIDRRQDDLDRLVGALQVQIAEKYVKKDDLRDTEQRITDRMSTLEHEVRQIPMKLAGLLRTGKGD